MGVGKIVRIIGPIIDVQFAPEELPKIYHALEVSADTPLGKIRVIAEVQQHLEDDKVRSVAMSSTDGLMRGMEVVDTGGPITVPVGEETLGRLFNLLGEPIDFGDPVKTKERYPIHRDPPEFPLLEPTNEVFETGIKVIDLLAPYPRGGKIGLFGGAGVGKLSLIHI